MEDQLNKPLYVEGVVSITMEQIKRQYKTMIILALISIVVTQTTGVFRYFQAIKKPFQMPMNIFTFYIYPWLFLTHLILAFIGLMNYYRAVKDQESAIAHNDQKLFAHSFNFFIKANKFHIIGSVLGLFSSAVFLWDQLVHHIE
jgi:hypothetical protein